MVSAVFLIDIYMYSRSLSARAFVADFPPAAPEFHQRTRRVRLRNLGTTDKKSFHKIKHRKIPRVHVWGREEPHMELTGRQIRISVRNLVEFVLRSGDIDNRRTAGAQKEAMLAGGRMHRKIQRRMGSGYQAEVSLRHSVEEDGFQIVVEGRADGIIRDGKDVTIDEIKCVYQDVNCLEEAVGVHMAQARCYGYIYGLQEALDEVTLQLTYCNLETEEIRRFQEIQTMDELSEWFAGLIHEYVKWARYLYHNGLRRDESIKALEFPYPYRAGQRDLAVAVYRTLERGRITMCCSIPRNSRS